MLIVSLSHQKLPLCPFPLNYSIRELLLKVFCAIQLYHKGIIEAWK